MSLEFFVTTLIIVLIPGTGVIFTVSTALMRGKRASVYAAIGCTLGIVPHLLATIFGLAALMHTSALAFTLLKYAGMLYLFYLALMSWRDTSLLKTSDEPMQTHVLSLVIKAILLNILNPKLTIFFLAFLPQFVHPENGDTLLQLSVLSLVFMGMTLIVFLIYGFLAHRFRSLVLESKRVQTWLKRSFAAVFAGLGIQLAYSTQK